jgi:hypothetical protein
MKRDMGAIEKVFAESPKAEIWRRLRLWSYASNAERKLEAKHKSVVPETLQPVAEEMATLVLQAEEYFRAAENVQLFTQPLQVYYGTVALLSALRVFHTGGAHGIGAHGLRLEPSGTSLLEWRIRVERGCAHGFAQRIAAIVSDGLDLDVCKGWTLQECLGSIPDMINELARNYQGRVELNLCPVTVYDTDEGMCYVAEDIGNPPLSSNWPDLVWRRTELFIRPEHTENAVVLRPRLQATEAQTILPRGTDGRLYLPLLHRKGTSEFYHSPLFMYATALYALSVTCRYRAREWGKLISRDDSGDLELIRNFLQSAIRQVPNLVLDQLHGSVFVFTSEHAKVVDLKHRVSKRDVEETIRRARNEERRRL